MLFCGDHPRTSRAVFFSMMWGLGAGGVFTRCFGLRAREGLWQAPKLSSFRWHNSRSNPVVNFPASFPRGNWEKWDGVTNDRLGISATQKKCGR